MNIVKQLATSVCLLPFVAFAAPATITDWQIESNGIARFEVGEQVVYVSPESQEEYRNGIMAARFQWPVDVKNGSLVIDTDLMPVEEQSLMAYTCTQDQLSCDFQGVTQSKYACMITGMKSMVVAAGGEIYGEWPSPTSKTGEVNFLIAAYSPIPFHLTFNYANPILSARILTAPQPYSLLWSTMDTMLLKCK